MKRTILIFGSILGVILAGNAVYMVSWICRDPYFKSNDVLGYAAMVIVFSLIFFGVRNFRNKQMNGVITLGKAFKTGALIALLGSTIYVVVGLSYYYLFAPEFMDQYTLHVLHSATLDGATETQLAAKVQEMEQFKTMYKNPLFVVLITYTEVLPIGLIVAFISALILKRKSSHAAGSSDVREMEYSN
jgi:hypothetical protein